MNVLLHGLKNFCVQLPPFLKSERWNIRNPGIESLTACAALLRDLWQSDLVFTWAGRISLGKFLWCARKMRKNKLVMFWAGTDVLLAQREFADGKLHPWIASKTHWGGAPWLVEEIRALGLPCEYVPMTWVHPPGGELSLPAEFSVLVYLPSLDRVQLYGLDQVCEVARSLPNIRFTLAGLRGAFLPGAPENLRQVHWLTDKDSMYRQCTVMWRPALHDGLSFMSLEALGYGRHVIWTYPFPGCIQATSSERARAEILRLHAAHQAKSLQVNAAGADIIAREFSPVRIKQNILQRWEDVILRSEQGSNAAPERGRAVGQLPS